MKILSVHQGNERFTDVSVVELSINLIDFDFIDGPGAVSRWNWSTNGLTKLIKNAPCFIQDLFAKICTLIFYESIYENIRKDSL